MARKANLGLGLEFCRQCLNLSYRIFAGCRKPESASKLAELAADNPENLIVLEVDVTNKSSITKIVKRIEDLTDTIDLLVNMAGIYPEGEMLINIEPETMLRTLHVNTIGPIIIVKHFLDLLIAAGQSKIINISSGMGSIGGQVSGYYSYRSSKAALNMLSRTLANELRQDHITVVALDPGWVQTDMGGSHAPLNPRESVEGMLRVIDDLSIKDTVKFLDWKGNEHPW